MLFAVIVTVEYSYYNALGRFTTLLDLATAFFTGVNRQMGQEAVFAYINWIALLPTLIFGCFLFIATGPPRRDISNFVAVFAAFVLYFAASTYFTSNQYYSPSLSNFVRTAVSYPAGWYLGTSDGPPQGIVYAQPRESVTIVPSGPPTNNVVFIVDESVRGDRLSVNGHSKPTTPTLVELYRKGAIANWGIAVSGTTCSSTSNPLLLTGLNQLPDKAFEVYRWPTIFQYAKASGYKNHYFDGHTNVHWLGKEMDIPDYGNWTKANDLGRTYRYERDAEIARRVKTLVETSTGNFIWVHKYGVHLRYENSFPNEDYSEFLNGLPANYDLTVPEETMQEIYDDALTYNLESFFSTLLKNGPAPNTIYIYTSDHGQSLRENGAVASHCDESKPEANVPMLMIADAQNLPKVDTQFKASHHNLFATLLDVMNYPETERDFPYSQSLLRATSADSKPRFYYSEQLHLGIRHSFDPEP